MSGSYAVARSWSIVRSVVHLGGPAATVGVEAMPPVGSDQAPAIDVDWLHLEPAGQTFTTRGNRILDLDGNRFRPRGVNRPGFHHPSLEAGVLTVPASDAREMWVWGANAVRLPLNQELWLANCSVRSGSTLTTYRTAATQAVQEITAHGMLAIVELAVSSRGERTLCRPPEKPYLKEMPDERSVPFWENVGRTFASNPLVAFDLFNEPHFIEAPVRRSGGTVSYDAMAAVPGPESTYRAVGMQRVYRAVRDAGADNLVFVAGTNWATRPGVALERPLDGYNIVLSSHNYCGDACDDGEPHLPPLIDTQLTPDVLARHPVVITETGWWRPWDSRYNRMIIDYANEHGELGWLIFGWLKADDDVEERQFRIIASWDESWSAGGGELTRPPSGSGTPVWNELADIRVARGFDARPVAEP
jgi:hypothetical protein